MYYKYTLENPRGWIASAVIEPKFDCNKNFICYLLKVVAEKAGDFTAYYNRAESAKAAFGRDYLTSRINGRNKWKKEIV